MKKIISMIGIVISVWLYYGTLIRNISELEKENLALDKVLKNLEKENIEKKIMLEKLTDLSQIEKEMKEKQGMIISEKINFFRIDKNHDNVGE